MSDYLIINLMVYTVMLIHYSFDLCGFELTSNDDDEDIEYNVFGYVLIAIVLTLLLPSIIGMIITHGMCKLLKYIYTLGVKKKIKH